VVTALSLTIGGLWSVTQYLDQQQKQTEQRAAEAELERRRVLGDFALDLTKAETRNGAAYAVASLAGLDAIPLLSQYLIEASSDPKAVTFQNALGQAFIVIGPDSVRPLAQLNRQSRPTKAVKPPLIVAATQPVLEHFMKMRAEVFSKREGILRGVLLMDARLDFEQLDGLDLFGVTFRSSNFCSSSLRGTDLRQARFDNSSLISAHLEDTRLEQAWFNDDTLDGASFDRAQGREVQFERASLKDTSFRQAQLQGARFGGAALNAADFSASNLEGADFSEAILVKARLLDASVLNAKLWSADLENADLSNTDLTKVEGLSATAKPYHMHPRDGADRASRGPNVLGANVSGAKIDQGQREYLCRYGAVNVSGGCADFPAADVPPSNFGSGFGAGGCW